MFKGMGCKSSTLPEAVMSVLLDSTRPLFLYKWEGKSKGLSQNTYLTKYLEIVSGLKQFEKLKLKTLKNIFII